MTCYHPLKGFDLGVKDNGKKDIIITSSDVDFIIVYENADTGRRVEKKQGNPDVYPQWMQSMIYKDWIPVPCGKCIGCQLKYSRDWANRCMLEAKYNSGENYFVTLTYNEKNINIARKVDENGEVFENYTLSKRDLQLFLKRLRKYYYEHYGFKDIRYFACGEYGSNTFRPHFHLILFNLPIQDLKTNQIEGKKGFNYSTSDDLEKIWNKGFVTVGACDWSACAYVARYTTKKRGKTDKNIYDDLGIEKEFVTMSLKPGIGYKAFEINELEIYKTDKIIMKTYSGTVTSIPPKYFDKLHELNDPEDMEHIKDMRKTRAESNMKFKDSSKSYFELLQDEETYKLRQAHLLTRNEI